MGVEWEEKEVRARSAINSHADRGLRFSYLCLYVADLSCLEDNRESTKFDAGVESILKKDGGQATRSLSSDCTRQRRKEANVNNGRGGALRKSNGCGNSRRVLFKNNVSVYRFDTERPPPSPQNGAGYDSGRRPTRDNEPRSCGHRHDTVVRPPTVSGSRDGNLRSSNDRANEQLNASRRPTEKPVTDNDASSSSSIMIVGDFEVNTHRRSANRVFVAQRVTQKGRLLVSV